MSVAPLRATEIDCAVAVGGELTTVCIDTDVGRGGWLTALHIETGTYTQANVAGETREGSL